MTVGVVTGAGGFIGSALVGSLRRSGHEVRAVHRRLAPGADFVADLTADVAWTEPLENAEWVVHLAARAHVLEETAPDPLAAFRAVNVEGTASLASAAAASGVRRFVFLSSAGVLGRQRSGVLTEAADPAPVTPYAVSKLEAETRLQDLDGSLEVVILRPPLVYGPGAPGNFGRLARLLDRGVPLPLRSARRPRSLLYLGNLVDAIEAALRPTAATGIFHVTDGRDMSTADLVRGIAAALDRPARLVAFPETLARAAAAAVGRRDDAERLFGGLRLDSSRFRAAYSWQPPFTVEEGLQATFVN